MSSYIIAEISCNHNGSLDQALELVNMSKEMGANAVKLQTFTADTITRDFKNKPKGTMWESIDLYALYTKAMTPWDWQIKLKAEADRIGIDLISSPFDETSVDFLVNELKVKALKVASFEIVDVKLLQKIAKTGLPVLMSNGMTTYGELIEAVHTLQTSGVEELTIFQCNSGYPAVFSEANLKTMKVIEDIFKCNVGVSDHTLFFDTENFKTPLPHVTPLEAVKLGASVIEVHVQMDREESRALMEKGLGGFDWAFSREPHEFKLMVDSVREYEKTGAFSYESELEVQAAKSTLGQVSFQPTEREKSSRKLRPSLWAVRDISKGEEFVFAADAANKKKGNFDSIRPGGGLHIRYADVIEGKLAKYDISEGTPLEWEMLI